MTLDLGYQQEPEAARFAFVPYARGNLHESRALPAAPLLFRLDAVFVAPFDDDEAIRPPAIEPQHPVANGLQPYAPQPSCVRA